MVLQFCGKFSIANAAKLALDSRYALDPDSRNFVEFKMSSGRSAVNDYDSNYL